MGSVKAAARRATVGRSGRGGGWLSSTEAAAAAAATGPVSGSVSVCGFERMSLRTVVRGYYPFANLATMVGSDCWVEARLLALSQRGGCCN